MKSGDLCFVDTNILLSATDEGRIHHRECRQVFQRAAEAGIHLAISGQIVREYLIVSTRDITNNGLGLTPHAAIHNIDEIRRRTVLLEESEPVTDQLRSLVLDTGVTGARVHDANVAAIMMVNNVNTLITENTSDFSNFAAINVIRPAEFVA